MKMFNWNKEAKKSDIELHKKTIEASIKYYKNRNNQIKVDELQVELDSLNNFYKDKE